MQTKPVTEKEMNQDFLLSSYDYDLPEDLIAQHPMEKRDTSRMMVLEKDNPPIDRHIRDVLSYLKKGDCLVLNNTRVIPARLYGVMADTQSPVECLLLKRVEKDVWQVIGKPGKKMRPGRRLIFLPGRLEASVLSINDEDGTRMIRFFYEGIWEERLDEAGTVPLPPYIHEKLEDPERYQTVYAVHNGSAAAPTAGLHFTKELLQEIQDKGVRVAELTLHVGLGTFRPVKEDNVLEHPMHTEVYSVSQNCADLINETKREGGRVICVGTTSCRTVESAVNRKTGLLEAKEGSTDLFIYPGFEFAITDGLLTNFHLPKSTLIMLVAALVGRERILKAYEEAVNRRYRFYSFGDCMLLLPGGC